MPVESGVVVDRRRPTGVDAGRLTVAAGLAVAEVTPA